MTIQDNENITLVTNNRIQIFIPTYNRAEKLIRAINSVRNQDHVNIEIIVLDNASDDSTQEMVHFIMQSESRIRYIRNNYNIGLIGNFNLISKYITESYFCVLTDDDTYESNFLTIALNVFSEHPNASAAIFSCDSIKNNIIMGNQLSSWKEGFYPPNTALNHIIKMQHPILTSCLFKNEVKNIFNFEAALKNTADIFFFIKLFTEYPTAISKKITCKFEIHDSNTTIIESGKTYFVNLVELINSSNKYLTEKNSTLRFKYPSFVKSIYTIIKFTPSSKEMRESIDSELVFNAYGKKLLIIKFLSIPHIYKLVNYIILTYSFLKNKYLLIKNENR